MVSERTEASRTVQVRDLGVTLYAEAHALQTRLQQDRHQGNAPDTLLLTEHLPVLTLGRGHPVADLRVSEAVLAERGIPIVQTERGGNITYHGPGQLVAYGIIDLRGWRLGAMDYVAGVEEAAIGMLAEFGLNGERDAHGRGIWIQGRKVASVGIHVRRWVTMHGIAINVGANLGDFELINACGMADVEMTSMAAETGEEIGMEAAKDVFVEQFCRVFDCARGDGC